MHAWRIARAFTPSRIASVPVRSAARTMWPSCCAGVKDPLIGRSLSAVQRVHRRRTGPDLLRSLDGVESRVPDRSSARLPFFEGRYGSFAVRPPTPTYTPMLIHRSRTAYALLTRDSNCAAERFA